jgi:hypothetical protein
MSEDPWHLLLKGVVSWSMPRALSPDGANERPLSHRPMADHTPQRGNDRGILLVMCISEDMTAGDERTITLPETAYLRPNLRMRWSGFVNPS